MIVYGFPEVAIGAVLSSFQCYGEMVEHRASAQGEPGCIMDMNPDPPPLLCTSYVHCLFVALLYDERELILSRHCFSPFSGNWLFLRYFSAFILARIRHFSLCFILCLHLLWCIDHCLTFKVCHKASSGKGRCQWE